MLRGLNNFLHLLGAKLAGCCESFASDSLDLGRYPKPRVGYFTHHLESSARNQANGFGVMLPMLPVGAVSSGGGGKMPPKGAEPRDSKEWQKFVGSGMLAAHKWDGRSGILAEKLKR